MIVAPLKTLRSPAVMTALLLATLGGGCASDGGGLFTTGSIAEPVAVTKVATDPACVTLTAQIDGLRKEGTVGRLEKAADGKSSTVTVQRASLSKQAQLNKANADFVAKCGPLLPKSTVASVAAPASVTAPVAAAAATAPGKAVTAAAKSGVTSAAGTAVTIAPSAATAAKAAAPAQ